MKQMLTLLAVSVASLCTAQLTPQESEAIEQALFLGNLTPRDLEYEKKLHPDPSRVKLIEQSLDKPLAGANAVWALHQAARTTPLSQILRQCAGLLGAVATPGQPAPPLTADTTLLPPDIAKAVLEIAAALQSANEQIRLAMQQLTADEKHALIEGLPPYAVEEPKVTFEFTKKSASDGASLLPLVAKVELWRMLNAAAELSTTVERAMLLLRQSRSDVAAPVRLKIGAINVLVCGRADDVHAERDATLTIDLGGNDTYLGRHGTGVMTAAVLIDLGGADRFNVGDLGVGSGLLGIGIARVVGGNDSFRTGCLGLGAGLCGVGAFAKEGGLDQYNSVALSQGFGQYGVGLMIDTAGDDRYDLSLWGQGASRTKGIGWLVDRSGSDIYRAGGLSLNSPLFKDVYYSFAMGCSSGYREDTGGTSGGVGLLTDLAGDDYYLAETYAIAASYWYALGSLYDGGGHDTYSGYHYVQASAMHFCAAYLFDEAGDDLYGVKFGAAHAIGHDYGVAMLLDRKGSDIYAARDSNPGVGNANGVGIFLDAEGDDRYQGPPGRANPARGTGSVAVFVDMGGADQYRTGLADGEGASTPLWGVAFDMEDPLRPRTGGADGGLQPTVRPGSLARPPDQDLERFYRKAVQWNVGTAQGEVAENLAKLIMIGLPAFEWMLDKHLAGASRLEQRVFVSMIEAIGEPAKLALVGRLLGTDERALRVGLQIALDASVKEAGPALPTLLKRPALVRQVVRAAGAIGGEEIVNDLLPLCLNEDRYLAASAMVSLAQIGSETAFSTAEALLSSPNLPLRKAALALCAKFPLRGIEAAKNLLLNPEERVARIGVELLAAIGTPDALAEAGSRLLDPSPGIRIQALLALEGRCPADHRQSFLALRSDPIPQVRAIAKRLDPGR